MKILHLDTGRALRGGQRQLLLLARGLKARGHEQLIVCPQDSGLRNLARREGFETLGITLHGVGSTRALLRLCKVIRSQNFQIVHAHDGRGQTFSWLASWGTPVRRVASRRVIFAPRGRLIHRLKYSYTCHGVIAVSVFVRDLLLRSGIPPSRIEVIPDGINFPGSPPSAAEKAQARRHFHLGERDFVIGHAGAFTAEKGQETAIQAFQKVAQRLPNARLLLAGDGERRGLLKEKYHLQDAQGPVRVLGQLDGLDSFMSCLDLFLMPSLFEGFGSSALMAMAHGVPVVASRTGGLTEIVTDRRTGWLAEPGSAVDLAEKILAAAADRGRLEEMGLRARAKANGFTDDIMTCRTEAFYCRLAEDPTVHR